MLLRQMDKAKDGIIALLITMTLHIGMFYFFLEASPEKRSPAPVVKEVEVSFISPQTIVQTQQYPQQSIKPVRQEVVSPAFQRAKRATVSEPRKMEPIPIETTIKRQPTTPLSTQPSPALEKVKEELKSVANGESSGSNVVPSHPEKQAGEEHKSTSKVGNLTSATHDLEQPALSYSLESPKQVSSVQYIRSPVKVYPKKSIQLEEQGRVLLSILIDESGHPQSVEIKNSSGYSRLDESARQSFLKVLFKPYKENGRAIPIRCVVPVNFSLSDEVDDVDQLDARNSSNEEKEEK